MKKFLTIFIGIVAATLLTFSLVGCSDEFFDSTLLPENHNFGEWYVTVEASCTEVGEEERDCQTCLHYEIREVEALGHEEETHEAVEPTHTEVGNAVYVTCTRCDYTTYEEIPAVGHNYETVVTEPTCTEKGFTTYTCECGDTYVDDYTDEIPHTFGEWVETEAPTCEEVGEEVRICEDCEFTETKEIEALGHSYNEVVTEPTCTGKGYTTYTCACSDTYVDNYVGATDHNYTEWEVTVFATCLNKGEEKRICQNDISHIETREIEALGHDEVVNESKAVTCEENGWEEYVTCTRCDYTTFVEVKAAGHLFGEWAMAIAPNCVTIGAEKRTCENCDKYEMREVEALGHDEVDFEAKAPACTEIGWNAYTTCTRCDYTTYEEIPALGHNYEEAITEPTCTEDGFTTYTCECGYSYEDNFVEALGHSESEWIVDTEADFEVAGAKHKECTVCGVLLEEAEIPVLEENSEENPVE